VDSQHSISFEFLNMVADRLSTDIVVPGVDYAGPGY